MNKCLLIAIAFLVYIAPLDVEAARLWTSGFELASTTSLAEWDTLVGTGGSIDSATKRSGDYSFRCNPTATTGAVRHTLYSGSAWEGGEVFIRTYIYITSATDALDQIIDIGEISLRMNSDRTLEVWDDDNSTQIGSDSAALNTDQWYRIELRIDLTASTQLVEDVTARIDGTDFVSATVSNGVTEGAGLFTIGCVTATTADIYFDDIAFNDVSGSAQTSYPGAGQVILMQPDSAGDGSAATAGTYADIDEVPTDEATTYIQLDTDGGQTVDYNLEASTDVGLCSSDTITLVHVNLRERAETAVLQAKVLRIKSQASGTVLESGSETKNDVAWSNTDSVPRLPPITSYTDPQAGGAWTPTLLDSTQIGIRSTDGNPDIHVTALWATVEYIEDTGCGGGGGGGGSHTPTAVFDGKAIFIRRTVIQ